MALSGSLCSHYASFCRCVWNLGDAVDTESSTTARVAKSWMSGDTGLSRSALADRFIHLIGVPPMHCLAQWRRQVATQKLRGTSTSLGQVAESVGYDSDAAFSRAFKKAYGVAPATWRSSNS